MGSSDSNNKDAHSYFSGEVFCSYAKKFETHHNYTHLEHNIET